VASYSMANVHYSANFAQPLNIQTQLHFSIELSYDRLIVVMLSVRFRGKEHRCKMQGYMPAKSIEFAAHSFACH